MVARALVAASTAAATCAAVLLWRRRRARSRENETRPPRVVVLCAVREEAVHVESHLTAPIAERTLHVGDRALRCVRGRVAGVDVEVVCCGIGLVDAAATTTALMLAHRDGQKTGSSSNGGASSPAHNTSPHKNNTRGLRVLNVGCSGGHSRDVRAGDVVVGEAVVPTGCKMLRADGTSEHVGLRLDTSSPPVREIEADAGLMALALACDAARLPPWPTTPRRQPRIFKGKLGSSDVWSQCPKDIHWQHTELRTLCEEMESFAVARVCTAFGVPWLSVKDIVNNELVGDGAAPGDDDDDGNGRDGAAGASGDSTASTASKPASEETGLGESLILEQLGRRAALVAIAVIEGLGRQAAA